MYHWVSKQEDGWWISNTTYLTLMYLYVLKQLVTFTVSHFASFLNFAQLAHMAKFKIDPRYAAVTVAPLTEVALVSKSFIKDMK